ncbi:MAG: MprA protease, GlyGly-CTERM protein-sorting domain-containing form, partial [Phycisphaerales bacterium]|nr:MprA protease, GlyGly-CTERM protein-sorting domain-containing form [Phycisphaerales bacterium]
DPITGAPEPVIITFRQTAADANTASQIIIDDEMILNMTGLQWTGYRQILGLSNNASISAASLGMSVGPEFTGNTLLNGNREMLSSGGPGVASGAMWMPGAVGGLVIDINLAGQADPVVFTLKELPVIPTPAAGALAVAGLAAFARRRR